MPMEVGIVISVTLLFVTAVLAFINSGEVTTVLRYDSFNSHCDIPFWRRRAEVKGGWPDFNRLSEPSFVLMGRHSIH